MDMKGQPPNYVPSRHSELSSQPAHLGREGSKSPKKYCFLWVPESIFSGIRFVKSTDIINDWLYAGIINISLKIIKVFLRFLLTTN